MTVTRQEIVRACASLVRRNRNILLIYIVAGFIAIYVTGGIGVAMGFQVGFCAFSLICHFFIFRSVYSGRPQSYAFAKSNFHDVISLIFVGYLVLYCCLYRTIMLFWNFHWIDLLVILFSFGFACAFYQNAKGINVTFRNLERLGDSSDMDSGDGWQAFLEEHRIPLPNDKTETQAR